MSDLSEVSTIIAMNRLVGDVFCLLKLINKLGIDTSYATLDGMEELAFKQFLKDQGRQHGSRL